MKLLAVLSLFAWFIPTFFPAFCHAQSLPMDVVFQGDRRFQTLMKEADKAGWGRLPIGERTARIGMSLRGIPYKNYTLELHDRVESPSVNMNGMDCWTFFEIALASARLLKAGPPYSKERMLQFIELDRYRGGRCNGRFSSRLHHLEDWAQDNERRGLVKDVTRNLGGVRLQRNMNYMGGSGSRHFRQLRADPSQIGLMRKIEANLSSRGIYYIPKSRVRGIESKIQSGDIICIVTTWHGSYTSHVGLAFRDSSGVLRFLHASRNKREVILDDRLSTYLNKYSKHAGIMVVRPLEG